MKISIVIPVYNEEQNIKQLYSELNNNLQNKDYEIIFVDDGSTDSTFEKTKELRQLNKKVKIIQFRRNFGKSAALSAGFEEATGDIIFTMDGDLQDDPKEIPNFLNKLNEGYDMVVGWKFKRHDPITKTIPSKFFNWLTRKVTGVQIHDSNCGFKALTKQAAKDLKIYGELHRYIPALAHFRGYKIGEIKVEHHPRKFGKSKYGFSRLFKGFLDLITVKYLMTYKARPSHIFGLFGLVIDCLSCLFAIILLYAKFIAKLKITDSIPLSILAILTILLAILGMQFITLGLLGEMIANSKPTQEDYSIKKKLK